MKYYEKYGSKERLFEMMSRVNKVTINEEATPEEMKVLEDAYEKLKRGALNIRQGGERATVLQNTEEGSFVEIGGRDASNNEYLFNFKIEGDEMGQDDTFQIEDVEVIKFHFNTADNSMVVDLEGDDLKNFNERYGANLYDTIERYVDIEIQPQLQDIGERIYEEIAKKMDSQPYGGSKHEFQDGMGYGDEKPVNPKIRTKAPELEKFVKEGEDIGSEIPEGHANKKQKDFIIQYLKDQFNITALDSSFYGPEGGVGFEMNEVPEGLDIRKLSQYLKALGWSMTENQGSADAYILYPDFMNKEKPMNERSAEEADVENLDGEELLQTKFHHLNADMEFRKLAQAYENLLKVKRIGFEPSDVLQRALSAARDLIAEYLQSAKDLNITSEDVQNFFQGMLTKFKSVVSEDDGKKMKDDPCWDDYEMVGMKKKDGKEVPNCVPKNEGEEEEELASVEVPSDQPEVPALDVDDVDDDGEELEGGLADNEPLPQFDPQQILRGIEVELEHTKDPKIALEIAMDHLMELPDYYTRLDQMEKQGEEETESGEFEKLPGMGTDEEGNPIPATDPHFSKMGLDNKDSDLDSNVPEELKGYSADLKDANKELENNILGFDTSTPNAYDDDFNIDEYWEDIK